MRIGDTWMAGNEGAKNGGKRERLMGELIACLEVLVAALND